MQALSRTTTTEMEVTSIRLERELKERLKQLAGNRGYQALIRDVLWHYVQVKGETDRSTVTQNDIRASIPATAHREEHCALTGELIQPQERMLLGFTRSGEFVPLSLTSLSL